MQISAGVFYGVEHSYIILTVSYNSLMTFFDKDYIIETYSIEKGEKYGNFQTVRGISNGAGRRVADLATMQGAGASGGPH